MPKYKLSKAAEQDIKSIWRYTAERWSVGQAIQYDMDIQDACQALTIHPELGRKRDDLHNLRRLNTNFVTGLASFVSGCHAKTDNLSS